MHCTFKFRPIGQGGFFTGDFSRNNRSVFQMVYDCGSVTAGSHLADQIEDARDNFRTEKRRKTVDMVIISHFDEDHVSGVLELLKGVHCKILIIPFMTIFERLIVYCRRGAKADWHRRLLQNPQAFFSGNEFTIDQIVMIDGNGEQLNQESGGTVSIDPDAIASSGTVAPARMANEVFTFSNQFVYMQTPLVLQQRELGLFFRFYIKPFPDAMITALQTELTAKFPHLPAPDLFQDKYRLIVKGLYKDMFGNINKTSLCVSIRRRDWTRVWYDDAPNGLFNYAPRITGILLTGDSYLKSVRDRAAFADCYADDLSDILVFQIPHHGSKANSKLDVTNAFWGFQMFVMNYGEGRVKHPSPEMNIFVTDHHYHVRRVTELAGFTLAYEIS